MSDAVWTVTLRLVTDDPATDADAWEVATDLDPPPGWEVDVEAVDRVWPR